MIQNMDEMTLRLYCQNICYLISGSTDGDVNHVCNAKFANFSGRQPVCLLFLSIFVYFRNQYKECPFFWFILIYNLSLGNLEVIKRGLFLLKNGYMLPFTLTWVRFPDMNGKRWQRDRGWHYFVWIFEFHSAGTYVVSFRTKPHAGMFCHAVHFTCNRLPFRIFLPVLITTNYLTKCEVQSMHEVFVHPATTSTVLTSIPAYFLPIPPIPKLTLPMLMLGRQFDVCKKQSMWCGLERWIPTFLHSA